MRVLGVKPFAGAGTDGLGSRFAQFTEVHENPRASAVQRADWRTLARETPLTGARGFG